MIKPENVRFPITSDELAALQRAHLGRPLTADELELFREIAEIANDTYAAAARGDVETVEGIMAAINTAPAPDRYTAHVAALCRGWALLGCLKGTKALKNVIEGIQ